MLQIVLDHEKTAPDCDSVRGTPVSKFWISQIDGYFVSSAWDLVNDGHLKALLEESQIEL
jgi:hypothetical protein